MVFLKNDQSTGHYIRTLQYYLIFTDGKVHAATEQLLGVRRPESKEGIWWACRFNLPLIQNWLLQRVRGQTPVEIENLVIDYNYDA